MQNDNGRVLAAYEMGNVRFEVRQEGATCALYKNGVRLVGRLTQLSASLEVLRQFEVPRVEGVRS
jgi:hypothetical protein